VLTSAVIHWKEEWYHMKKKVKKKPSLSLATVACRSTAAYPSYALQTMTPIFSKGCPTRKENPEPTRCTSKTPLSQLPSQPIASYAVQCNPPCASKTARFTQNTSLILIDHTQCREDGPTQVLRSLLIIDILQTCFRVFDSQRAQRLSFRGFLPPK
jgi:hypothetical protein